MIGLDHIAFEGIDPVSRGRPCPCSLPRPGPAPHPRDAAHTARDSFLAWMLGTAGLDASVYRDAVLQRRLVACLRSLRVSSSAEARALLQRHPERRTEALSQLLIGVTSFHRDPPVFEALTGVVMPELTGRGTPLRVLSLGCSTGQELNSVAMLLAEAGILERSELLGVDCRWDAIARARAGVYSADEVSSLPPYLAEKYLGKVDRGRRVSDELQARIRWVVADVFDGTFGPPFDLVLFRNVAIYIAGSESERLWDAVHASLAPGGFLVTGKAERPLSGLGLCRLGPSLYWRPLNAGREGETA